MTAADLTRSTHPTLAAAEIDLYQRDDLPGYLIGLTDADLAQVRDHAAAVEAACRDEQGRREFHALWNGRMGAEAGEPEVELAEHAAPAPEMDLEEAEPETRQHADEAPEGVPTWVEPPTQIEPAWDGHAGEQPVEPDAAPDVPDVPDIGATALLPAVGAVELPVDTTPVEPEPAAADPGWKPSPRPRAQAG